MKKKVIEIYENASLVHSDFFSKDSNIDSLSQIVHVIVNAFKNDNKVLLCGNGGSAADAQHIAAELSGRFYMDRPPLFAEALHVNTSYLTAVANDYSYDEVYSRLIISKGKKGDVLIGISTSGKSKNVYKALVTAKDLGMHTISFCGKNKTKYSDVSEICINIPSEDTPRIQEMHILVGHIICQLVEERIFS